MKPSNTLKYWGTMPNARLLFPIMVASLALACRPSRTPPQEPPAAAAPAPDTSVNTEPQPPGPDAAADSLLVDVQSVDSTIRVDARYAGSHNFTGARLPGYDAPRAWLRREPAAALGRVQARLRSEGLGLLVFDAYRPVRATLAMVDWANRTGRADLLNDGYIARRSRHNQGVAVDLTLVDRASGAELDMGTPFDTFSEAAHTANAAGQVQRYRQILVHAMQAEGFANYEKEWWHFTYSVPGAVPFDKVIQNNKFLDTREAKE
jgi:D-alanyl-D-alanine dipeptidase